MNINVSQNIPLNNNYKYQNKQTSLVRNDVVSDSFSSSTDKTYKTVSFSGKFLESIFGPKQSSLTGQTVYEIPSKFAADISKGIERVMGCKIPAKNFKSIMTPDEFRVLLPDLKEENFTSSKKNQESGIYSIDLDYQTSFSSGVENVFDILDNVATYANNYYQKTGKDFIFAITDKDSIEGLQHAIRIIGSDPDKYKHLKIIPGLKLSFAHQAPNSLIGYENSDMLIYGINPFSKNIIDFVETTLQKRKNMTIDFIKRVNRLYPEFAYNIIEFAQQNRIKYKKDYGVSNLYWRAREYAETKGDTEIRGITMVPKEIIEEADAILSELDEIYLGSTERTYSALGSQIIKDNDVNKRIKQVFDEYSTHFDNNKGRVVSSAENLYDDMIDCLSAERERPTLALAAPYYLSHYYEKKNPDTFVNVVEFIQELQENSNGMLIAFESVSPAYDLDKNMTPEKIKNFNNFIRTNTNLYEVGGSFSKRNS